jgi:hypothetical protein
MLLVEIIFTGFSVGITRYSAILCVSAALF